MQKDFIHLRLKTEFSILNSLIFIESLAENLKNLNFNACAITDFRSLSGGLQFSSILSKKNIKPIIGISLPIFQEHLNQNFSELSEIGLLAKNENGYLNLLNIFYELNFNSKHPSKRFILKELEKYKEDLICLSGSRYGIIRNNLKEGHIEKSKEICTELKDIFKDNFFIEISRFGLKDDKEEEDFLIDLAMKNNLPLVATNETLFLNKAQYEAFDALLCVKNKDYISSENREIYNSEFYLKTKEEMIDLFSDIPESIENTINIAKKCSFKIEERKPKLPSYNTQISSQDESDILEKNVEEGLKERIKEIKNLYQIDEEKYWNRFKFEIEIIKKMNFSGYFLVVADFINWAKKNKISVGPGRGSGAGSIIAWSLRITGLDPLKYGLLFERFLNPDRISMPDFDIDFCQKKREKVIQYVKHKYGDLKVANIITYGKLNAKAAIKDIGRVMHIPYVKLDEISKMIPFNPLEQITIQKALELDPKFQKIKENDIEIEQLINLATEVEGLIRHSSVHAAGMIISNEDLYKIAPVDKDEETGNMILAYDMKDAEKIGLVKFDFLGLKTLSVIDQILDLLKEKNININIEHLKTDDEKTFELLRSGNLKGIFQFEAAIPRMTLKKIKTDKIEDLMAITSLARPGPMSNIPTYIKRKIGQEKTEYYHPALKESLEETFGIIIYQEQVMQVVQILGGYSLGEADLVRKAMGKKIQAEMDHQKSIFIEKAEQKGLISKKQATEMFEIIAKFAGYGFNRAHAASYALISYQTAYLKAHYPIQFFIANLNLEIEHTSKINFFIIDCKKFNIEILPPDINKSDTYFKEENGKIRYGLAALKGIGINSSEEICKIKYENKNFNKIEDLLLKCKNEINKKNLEALIFSGALSCFNFSRKTLSENIEKMLKFEKNSNQVSLFDNSEEDIGLILEDKGEFEEKEILKYEFEFFGFYFSFHPLNQIKEELESLNVITLDQIEDQFVDKEEKEETLFYISGVVIKFIQRFKKNSRFAFLHLIDFDGMYEVMIFNEKLIDKYSDLLQEGKSMILLIDAKKNEESGIKLLVKDIFDVNDFITENKNKIKKTTDSKKETAEKKFKNEEKRSLIKIKNNEKENQIKPTNDKTLIIKCENEEELNDLKNKINDNYFLNSNIDKIIIKYKNNTILKNINKN